MPYRPRCHATGCGCTCWDPCVRSVEPADREKESAMPKRLAEGVSFSWVITIDGTRSGLIRVYLFAVIRPGVLTGTLHNWPADVTNSVFRSGPPNAQFVVSSLPNGTNSSSLPVGESI